MILSPEQRREPLMFHNRACPFLRLLEQTTSFLVFDELPTRQTIVFVRRATVSRTFDLRIFSVLLCFFGRMMVYNCRMKTFFRYDSTRIQSCVDGK